MSGIYSRTDLAYNVHNEKIPGTYEHYSSTFSSIYRTRMTKEQWQKSKDMTIMHLLIAKSMAKNKSATVG
ncbi:MAG: hypothetical protein Edafosvirus2_30 [Edafosvirus sp.]|uniref:Uncharacterized protein n=1 Tax=Edafosvirus sp. TaxID=2487765 RepID=A0A3G4ZV26_9VIRU|nr:MAG: hypothetical protein Edafosvirus2_30 [Edafosvirus sp.]